MKKELNDCEGAELISELNKLANQIGLEAAQNRKDRLCYLLLENLRRVDEITQCKIIEKILANNPQMSRGVQDRLSSALMYLDPLARFEIYVSTQRWRAAAKEMVRMPQTEVTREHLPLIRGKLTESAAAATSAATAHVPEEYDRHDRKGSSLRAEANALVNLLRDLELVHGDRHTMAGLLAQFGGFFDDYESQTTLAYELAGDRDGVLRSIRRRIKPFIGNGEYTHGSHAIEPAEMCVKHGFSEEAKQLFGSCIQMSRKRDGVFLQAAAIIALHDKNEERLRRVLAACQERDRHSTDRKIWQVWSEARDAFILVAEALGMEDLKQQALAAPAPTSPIVLM